MPPPRLDLSGFTDAIRRRQEADERADAQDSAAAQGLLHRGASALQQQIAEWGQDKQRKAAAEAVRAKLAADLAERTTDRTFQAAQAQKAQAHAEALQNARLAAEDVRSRRTVAERRNRPRPAPMTFREKFTLAMMDLPKQAQGAAGRAGLKYNTEEAQAQTEERDARLKQIYALMSPEDQRWADALMTGGAPPGEKTSGGSFWEE